MRNIGITPQIHNFDFIYLWKPSFTLRPFLTFWENLDVRSIGRWVSARHYLNASEKENNVFILPGNERRFCGCPVRYLVATPSDWIFAVLRNFDSQIGRYFLSAYLVSHTETSTDKRWNYLKGTEWNLILPFMCKAYSDTVLSYASC